MHLGFYAQARVEDEVQEPRCCPKSFLGILVLGSWFLGTVLISTGPRLSMGTTMLSKKFSGNLGSWFLETVLTNTARVD